MVHLNSGVLPVTSGVLQGSVLGPLLSILTSQGFHTVMLYAEDLMLYRPIYLATDYHLLQMDIDNLCVWSDDNLFEV